ncbi:hypothetical protein SY88_16580 [Clostridiales bacterium PH28_bin88]|nr:hypothetical protein SY88_16580 [Clostridiales bacterium PH28_bin88]
MWLDGLLVAFQGENILFLLLGTLYGLLIGALPGLGPSFGVASMLPLTYNMEPATAIIFLAAIHASTTYGDSIASILINTPGGAGSVASCWDGYPLARQGKSGLALGISTGGSLAGGIVGWLSLVLISPILVTVALLIGPTEYTMIALLALSLLSVAAQGETIKGLMLGGLGLLLAFIGPDPINGFMRFTFGLQYFEDTIEIIPVALGLFALSQAIALGTAGSGTIAETFTASDSVWSGVKEAFRRPVTMIRSGIIGILLGVMPALGISTANIVAYLMEKRAAKDPETFGQGNVNGLLAPEVAKNACVVGDLIPTFTLGIPGSATTALFLAALMLHGITPGPEFFQKGVLPYAVFIGILMSQVAFFGGGMLLARYFAHVVRIPNAILVPLIMVLSVLGSYAYRNELLDVVVMIVFGILGYILSRHRYPVACIVLGLVLGQMLEGNFQRALILGDGKYTVFVTEPISLVLLIVTILFLAWPYLAPLFKRVPSYLAPSGDD